MMIPTSKISPYIERRGKIEVENPCVSSSFLSDSKHQVPCLRDGVLLASNLPAISKIKLHTLYLFWTCLEVYVAIKMLYSLVKRWLYLSGEENIFNTKSILNI